MQGIIFCKYFEVRTGKCNCDEHRWLKGLFRSTCNAEPMQESACEFRERPDGMQIPFDSVAHGAAVDADDFEWEVSRVTDDSLFLRVRDPYDGKVEEIAVARSMIKRKNGPARAPE